MNTINKQTIETINEGLRCLQSGNLPMAFARLEEAQQLAGQQGVNNLMTGSPIKETVLAFVADTVEMFTRDDRNDDALALLEWAGRYYPEDFPLNFLWGQVFNRMKAFDKSIPQLKYAVQCFDRSDTAPSVVLAACINSLAAAYYLSRRRSEAVAIISGALGKYRFPPDAFGQLDNTLKLCKSGSAVFLVNNNEMPELERIDQLMDHADECLERGALDAARKSLEQALVLVRRHGFYLLEAACFFQLGGVELESSHFVKAAQFYEKSAEIRLELGDKKGYMDAVFHGQKSFHALHQHRQAEPLAAETAEVCEELPQLNPVERMRYMLPLVWYRRHDKKLVTRFMELFYHFLEKKKGRVQQVSEAFLVVEAAFLIPEDYGGSQGIFQVPYKETILESALEIFKEKHLVFWEARALSAITKMRLNGGRSLGAEVSVGSALLLQRTRNPYETLHLYEMLAEIQIKEERFEEAVDALRTAVDYGEQVRSVISKDKIREDFFRRVDSSYRRLVKLLIETGRPEEALTYAERTNARVLGEQLAGIKPPPKLAETGVVAQRYAKTRAALDCLWEQAFSGQLQGQALNSLLQPLQQEMDRVRTQLLEIDPEYGHHITGFLPDWRNALRWLKDRQCYLFPFLLADGWVLFRVTCDDVHAEYIPGDRDKLVRLAAEFRHSLLRSMAQPEQWAEHPLPGETAHESRPPLLQLAHQLYQHLAAPLEPYLKNISEIAWIADYALLDIPPAVLYDGSGYLVERFVFRTAVSIGLDAVLAKERKTREIPCTALLLGDPDGTLPRSGDEVRELARMLNEPVVCIGASAGLAAIKDCLPRAGLIHCACHSVFDAKDPSNSFLKLAKREDGLSDRFTVHDLYNLRTPVAIMVLSACQTARVRADVGNERHGFIRGAFYAGAASVLSSLWPVEDTATMVLMKQFYLWARNCPTANALAAAQRGMIQSKQWQCPGFWAPFQLNGVSISIKHLFA